ncbi:MAG: mercuric reductase [Acidobacteria bacterium]|nr:MAG: mercuric reductase [Acidobacteriota bacterium]RPJ63521.1 MAG: mercuric reductase [Acidobacteriota bacterium]
MDQFNEKLVQNVHPPDWTNPEPSGRYNLVVLGAGTAGLVSAAIGAALGARVALVERYLMGGDCLNVGCVPSKAIIRSSRVAADLRDACKYGVIGAAEAHVDFAAVMERMRRLRSEISPHDSAARFSRLGVDVFLGDARFTGRDSIEVSGTALRFKKAIIATGARPAAPAIPGLEEAGYLTNETVFSLTELPREFLIIGAGPIGCELAQAFARLGSRVTLVTNGERILPREDQEAASLLAEALERDGVRLLLGSEVERVTREGARYRVGVARDGSVGTFAVDHVLVGVGRTPNVEGLNLEAAGVESGNGRVKVDDHLRTSNRHIFAAGDVCSAFKFTHVADFAARIAAQNALFPFLPGKKLSRLVIPWCTYTDPEIAHTGAYPGDLEKAGVSFETLRVPLEETDRAVLDGEHGFLKVHVDSRKGALLGATLVARHAGEMISELTLAMTQGVKLGAISGVIHPYPTQAEVIRKAADTYNRKRLTPSRKRLLKRIFAWLR